MLWVLKHDASFAMLTRPLIIYCSTIFPYQEKRYAWAQIKSYLLTTSPSQGNASNDPPLTAALDKIHEQLLLIEVSVSVSQNTAEPTFS